MYTRNNGRSWKNSTDRYSPPPGYTGNAFGEHTGLKHHPPDQHIDGSSRQISMAETDTGSRTMRRPQEEPVEERQERSSGIREENIPVGENTVSCRGDDPVTEPSHEGIKLPPALRELLANLSGRIGSEELIILLVLLLVASEGIGAEVLILALSLLAG